MSRLDDIRARVEHDEETGLDMSAMAVEDRAYLLDLVDEARDLLADTLDFRSSPPDEWWAQRYKWLAKEGGGSIRNAPGVVWNGEPPRKTGGKS